MANWQERADAAKQQSIEITQRDHHVDPLLIITPQVSPLEQRYRNALEQLENLCVSTMLGEINRDTRFWGGLGVLSSERSGWKAFLPEQTLIYKLYGDIDLVREKWTFDIETKFGIYFEGGGDGGQSWGNGPGNSSGSGSEEMHFGFHNVGTQRLIGYERVPRGLLLHVNMAFSHTHGFNIYTQSSSRTGTSDDQYTQDGFLLNSNRALSVIENALLKAIQQFDEGPTLEKLQQAAQEQNDKLIAKIKSRIGQTSDQYNKIP